MPIGSALYWDYLAALSTIKGVERGDPVDSQARALLRDAESLAARFQDTQACFWTVTHEFEGASPEYSEALPYDVDLREPETWRRAIERL